MLSLKMKLKEFEVITSQQKTTIEEYDARIKELEGMLAGKGRGEEGK